MLAESKPKVLMLDDERLLLDMYRMALEKDGYDVLACDNADSALESLRGGFNPDVILFDITMPDGKSGYEFIDIVQREKLAPRSLKVVLTNEGRDGVLKHVEELGADAHLMKSKYTQHELAAVVTEMLKKRA